MKEKKNSSLREMAQDVVNAYHDRLTVKGYPSYGWLRATIESTLSEALREQREKLREAIEEALDHSPVGYREEDATRIMLESFDSVSDR